MINRLIILGNGFDLAHGLKTKYSNFVEDYYSKIKHSSEWSDEFYHCKYPNMVFNNYTSLNSILDHLSQGIGYNQKNSDSRIEFAIENAGKSLEIRNNLFYHLSKTHSIENWVDIENEYFKRLIYIIDYLKNFDAEPVESNLKRIREDIFKLNKEMDEIANRFQKYLSSNVLDEIDNKYTKAMEEILLNEIDLNTLSGQNFLNEFKKSYSLTLKNNGNRIKLSDSMSLKYNNSMILNFNYTKTFEVLYHKAVRTRHDIATFINIHGSLNDNQNPINLGFGDEMSKRYGDLEDFNENEYLRLMKSFAYSNNDNYKRLFDFIETQDFQVHIMGHSCGISDRTLLNAIFENHNCKSIKVFYHKGKSNDNYSDIVRNISRHFNQKTMMREKIVNKEYCTPLPQFFNDNEN